MKIDNFKYQNKIINFHLACIFSVSLSTYPFLRTLNIYVSKTSLDIFYNIKIFMLSIWDIKSITTNQNESKKRNDLL